MRIILTLMLLFIGIRLAHANECASSLVKAKKFLVCQVDLTKENLGLYSKDRNNKPYGSLYALRNDLLKSGKHLAFAMNAGMYQQDLTPLGLFVSDGQTLHPLNEKSGKTNFYMRPNGVFYVDKAGAGILSTTAYKASLKKPSLATQSGPMLVLNGKITTSSVMSASSRSLNVRNAVCVSDAQHPKFVISEDAVTFYELADFLLNDLHCKNALYLDGFVSSIYAPQVHRRDGFEGIGTFFVVTIDHE